MESSDKVDVLALAEEIARALYLRYGEITFKVRDGTVTYLTRQEVVHQADAAKTA